MSLFDDLRDGVSELLEDADDVLEVHQRPSHSPGGFLDGSTQEIPAEGLVERTDDITAGFSAGESQTATRRADSGEVWELTDLEIEWTGPSETGVEGSISVETEGGIELAFAEDDDDALRYRSGSWNNTAPTTERGSGNPEGTRIDESDGISVVVTETGETTATDADVNITWKFQRLVV